MNQNSNTISFYHLRNNSSSAYNDYISSSSQYNFIKKIIINYITPIINYNKVPNKDTIDAINEARNSKSLKSYHDFNQFLKSLEE